MRLLVLVAFLCSIQSVTGQELLNQPISISFNAQTVEKCLTKIQQASGISFSYNSKQIAAVETRITASFKEEPLKKVLDRIFQNTAFAYKEIGNQVTIYEIKSSGETVVLTGYVRNASSREEIAGAKIYFPQLAIGCLSNSYGYYAIELPKGKTVVRISSLGMKPLKDTLDIQENMVFNILLEENSIELNTVSIISRDSTYAKTEGVDLSNVDKTTITREAVLRLPASAGEVDLLKYIQQFPGVHAANDGGANFQVRGSASGNNLILLDEIPIYHPTHMLGVYSVINMDAIKSAELYKDYIPARYGSRNASVLSIQTKEGDLQKYHVTGGVSFISARMNLEGPIIKNKASFYISGRKSLFPGVGSRLLNSTTFSYPRYYDLHAKVNYHINSNNRIYLTGYFGQDRLTDTLTQYKWGNIAGAFRWNHIFNSKTFSNLSITHSEFNYAHGSSYDNDNNEVYGQKVVTDKINYNFTNFFRSDLRIDYGAELAWIRTRKGNRAEKMTDLFLERNAFENGLYVAADKKFSPRLSLKAGLRIPVSFHIGTQDTTTYLDYEKGPVSVIYEKNKLYDLMFFVDPRILLSYAFNENNRMQFAVNVTSQNTHCINYVNYFLPVGIWTTSNAFLKPERNYSQSIGWIHDNKFLEGSVTVFNRYVRNVIDYASPIFTSSQDIESNLLSGNLHAYGMEIQLNFNKSKNYSATLSYTYTKTSQFIPGINNDKPYVVSNDMPHYFTFSQYFVVSEKWRFASNFIFHSGAAITLPNGQFVVNGTVFPLFPTARNAERLPYSARVDVAFTRHLGIKKNRNRFNVVFTITNLFGRTNPSVVYVDKQLFTSNTFLVNAIDYSPFMVSVNLNYKF